MVGAIRIRIPVRDGEHRVIEFAIILMMDDHDVDIVNIRWAFGP